MIEFRTGADGAIEIDRYSADCTLSEFFDRYAAASRDRCGRCGRCCGDVIPLNGFDLRRIMAAGPAASFGPAALSFPAPPDLAARRAAIVEIMATHELDEREAAALYEYNNAAPVAMRKRENGRCLFAGDRLCTRYEDRILICRLYHCDTGPRLAACREMIVNRGVWHSYFVLGWVSDFDIAGNPFLAGDDYGDILLGAFDHRFAGPVGDLQYLV